MTATTKKNERDQVALLVTYMNIVLYALCFQLQRPVEPFLVKSLASQADGNSADISKTYGRLQSFFNAIQTVGSPLVGVLLDKVGIRKASVLVFGATALSYLILACASDMKLLFLSKVPTVLQAAFLVAQATASTATGGDATARAAALGRMTTAYTVGATVGPALGGWFADKGDLYFSAKLAVLGSLVSVVLSWLYLPNSKNDEQKQKRTIEKNESFSSSLKASLSIGLRSSVWPLLTVKLLGGVVASIFSTALPLVLTQKIGFDASQLGLSMSASMFSVAVFSAVFMAPMANAVGPNGMTKLGLLGRAAMAPTMAIIFATTAVDHSNRSTSTLVMQVAATSVLHALSAHSLATGLTTQTTGAVANDEQDPSSAMHGIEGAEKQQSTYFVVKSLHVASSRKLRRAAMFASLIALAPQGVFGFSTLHVPRSFSPAHTTTTTLSMSLKPAALPLMDSGKALARSGELLIDMTQTMSLYGGGLSAAGAQIRNAGDCLAQAAASCRFKTGAELVMDELREAATCLQEASDKCKLATEEAKTDENAALEQQLINMIGPMTQVSQDLEAAGAGILQRAPLPAVGERLVKASEQLAVLSTFVDEVAQSTTNPEPIAEGTLASQRMKFAAEKMKEAGNKLQGKEKEQSKGRAFLKGL